MTPCKFCASILGAVALTALTAMNVFAQTQPPLAQSLPEHVRSAGVLQVGGPTAIAPYVMIDKQGNIGGVIVELMHAVGAKLGVDVKFNNIAYSALIPALQAGRVDVGIGTFTDTLARQEQVDFVDYITTRMVLMGHPETGEKITGIADLCGLTAASPSGTTSERLLKAQAETCKTDGKDALNLLIVPTPAEAYLQVKTGRADTFIQAYGVGIGIAASDPKITILGDPFRPEYHGAGVKKGNTELADALMAGFKAIMDDGSYDAILKKYGIEHLALKEPVLNGASTKPLTP